MAWAKWSALRALIGPRDGLMQVDRDRCCTDITAFTERRRLSGDDRVQVKGWTRSRDHIGRDDRRSCACD